MVYFLPITLLLILQWHTRVYEKMFDVNSLRAQTTQNIWNCWKIESVRNGKLRRLSLRFQTLIWSLGYTVQNVESPGLSGRADSAVVGMFLSLTYWQRTLRLHVQLLLNLILVYQNVFWNSTFWESMRNQLPTRESRRWVMKFWD